MIGRVVSHYEIVERLGRGGMGVVYHGRDLKLGRLVALKCLPPEVAGDRDRKERFVREARAASALDHPNVCTIHEFVESEEGELFLVMAYYRGETLQERIASGGRLPLRTALSIAGQTARGLAAAHSHGIVHRDLKPSNVMITSDGLVKILDFGLAKLADEARLTRVGTAIGTVAYMSPEQLTGGALDARTDIWSLGVLLYEMVTGELPFVGGSEAAMVYAIAHGAPRRLEAAGRDLPEPLVAVLERSLAKDPEARYASVEAMIVDLERLEADADGHRQTEVMPTRPPAPTAPPSGLRSERDVPTGVAGPAGRGSRRLRRPLPRRATLALAVVAVVLSAGLLYRVLGPRATEGDPPTNVAVLPFDNQTGAAELDAVAEGLAAGLIIKLSEISGLRVIGRTEAWSAARGGLGTTELAEQLGVEAIVEGQLRRQGDALRVDLGVVDGPTGTVLASQAFNQAAGEIFALQEEIARYLARFFAIPLSREERRRLALAPTGSLRAFQLYLDAYRRLDSEEPDAAERAVDLLRQAIRQDPEFALAHAGLSESLWRIHHRSRDPSILDEAEAAARRALELDPQLPAALLANALVARSRGEGRASVDELKKLLASHPNPAQAHRELANAYGDVGDVEAAESAYRAAAELDPDNWTNWWALGAFLLRKGDYGEARRNLLRAEVLAPADATQPVRSLAALALFEQRWEDAIVLYERLPRPLDDAAVVSNLATAYYFSERPDRLQRAADLYATAVRLRPHDARMRRNLADAYAALGRDDAARAAYGEALRLVEEELEVNPTSPALGLRRTLYAAKAGRCELAEEAAVALAATLPRTAEALHDLAASHAICGRDGPAIAALRQAVELGFSPGLVAREEEFAGLHGDPAFRALTEGPAGPQSGPPGG